MEGQGFAFAYPAILVDLLLSTECSLLGRFYSQHLVTQLNITLVLPFWNATHLYQDLWSTLRVKETLKISGRDYTTAQCHPVDNYVERSTWLPCPLRSLGYSYSSLSLCALEFVTVLSCISLPLCLSRFSNFLLHYSGQCKSVPLPATSAIDISMAKSVHQNALI